MAQGFPSNEAALGTCVLTLQNNQNVFDNRGGSTHVYTFSPGRWRLECVVEMNFQKMAESMVSREVALGKIKGWIASFRGSASVGRIPIPAAYYPSVPNDLTISSAGLSGSYGQFTLSDATDVNEGQFGNVVIDGKKRLVMILQVSGNDVQIQPDLNLAAGSIITAIPTIDCHMLEDVPYVANPDYRTENSIFQAFNLSFVERV